MGIIPEFISVSHFGYNLFVSDSGAWRCSSCVCLKLQREAGLWCGAAGSQFHVVCGRKPNYGKHLLTLRQESCSRVVLLSLGSHALRLVNRAVIIRRVCGGPETHYTVLSEFRAE